MNNPFSAVVCFFNKAQARKAQARKEPVKAFQSVLEPTPQRVDCAWCSKTIRGGAEPVSHGICEACAQVFFPRQAAKRA